MIEEWRRLIDFGMRVHAERQCIAKDLERLKQKYVLASDNHQKATYYCKLLAEYRDEATCPAEIWELEDQLRINGQKRNLYLRTTTRIYGILRMNEIFELMLSEMADHIQHALHASLDIMRAMAEGRPPERHLENEFAQACGRLHSYRKLYEQV